MLRYVYIMLQITIKLTPSQIFSDNRKRQDNPINVWQDYNPIKVIQDNNTIERADVDPAIVSASNYPW